MTSLSPACLSYRQFPASIVGSIGARANGKCHGHQVICDEEGVLSICELLQAGTAYRHSAMSRMTVWPRAAGSAITQPWLALGCRIFPLRDHLVHLPGDRYRSSIKAPTGRVKGLLRSPTPVHLLFHLSTRCYSSKPRLPAMFASNHSNSRENLPPLSGPHVQ